MNTLFRLNSTLTRSLKFAKYRFNNFSETLKDKEKGDEKVFINKQEKELMKKLLSKLEKQGEVEQAKGVPDSDAERLTTILKRHNTTLPNGLVNDILAWKKGDL